MSYSYLIKNYEIMTFWNPVRLLPGGACGIAAVWCLCAFEIPEENFPDYDNRIPDRLPSQNIPFLPTGAEIA